MVVRSWQLYCELVAGVLLRSPRASKRAREDEDGLDRYLRDLGHSTGNPYPAARSDEMPMLFPDGDALPYQLTDLPNRQRPDPLTADRDMLFDRREARHGARRKL